MTAEAAEKPSLLFVCVHNAGRSQMAAAFLTTIGDGRFDVRSAGSAPADEVNPAGQGVAAVRPIRDEIKARIVGLIASLTPAK